MNIMINILVMTCRYGNDCYLKITTIVTSLSLLPKVNILIEKLIYRLSYSKVNSYSRNISQ